MRAIGPVLALVLALSLAGCFVQHRDLIGAAEPATPGQWSGFWVAEPLEAGGDPGYFVIADVDPATGAFSVAEADGDGHPIEAPIPLHLRRVGDTLFLDVRDRADGPWLLFVVAELDAARIVLAWKPESDGMAGAFAAGKLEGSMQQDTGAGVVEVALIDFSPARQQGFARDWPSLFTPERMVLNRMSQPE